MLLQQEKKLREPGLFGKFFGGSSNKPDAKKEQKMIKPRKAPIKVEPKVFFANERTFLAWMHISIILAGASIAILAFSDYDNIGKQIYGLITLPVAIAFIVYSMYQCKYSPTFEDPWRDMDTSSALGIIDPDFLAFLIGWRILPSSVWCECRRTTSIYDQEQASRTLRRHGRPHGPWYYAHDFHHCSVCYQAYGDDQIG